MSANEKGSKNSRLIRQKTQEFLSTRKNTECLTEICKHFSQGQDLVACIQSLDTIFTTLLQNRDMFVEIVPLKGYEDNPDNKLRDWLKNTFEECFNKIVEQMDSSSDKIQTQGEQIIVKILWATWIRNNTTENMQNCD